MVARKGHVVICCAEGCLQQKDGTFCYFLVIVVIVVIVATARAQRAKFAAAIWERPRAW